MDFPGNSQNVTGDQKKVEKKIEKVITGEVIQKPKPIAKRFKGIFFGGEFKSAMRYVVSDVIIPAIRNTIFDVAIRGSERVIYGEKGQRRYGGSINDPRRPHFSYNQISTPPKSQYRSTILPDTTPSYSQQQGRGRRPEGQDIVIVSREEAELVLEAMVDILEKYDEVSVADLNELLGLPSAHIDNKWGWTNLGRSGIRQIREGYLLELPGVEPLS